MRITFSLLGYELIALDIGEPPVCGCGGEANLTASHLEHAAPAGIGFRVDPIRGSNPTRGSTEARVVPIDHTITAHPAGKSLTLADLRAFIDNAARFGAALNAQVNLKVGFSGNLREMSITVPEPSARSAPQQQQSTTRRPRRYPERCPTR